MLVRLILRRATAGGLLWAGFGLTSLLYAACYKFIAGAMGACVRAPAARCAERGWQAGRARCNRPVPSSWPARLRPPAAPHRTSPPHTHPPPAAPVYGEGGQVIFAGQDLSLGGALSYFHDSACLLVLRHGASGVQTDVQACLRNALRAGSPALHQNERWRTERHPRACPACACAPAVVYICLFVQLLGCWTDKAWWAFAAVRCCGCWP